MPINHLPLIESLGNGQTKITAVRHSLMQSCNWLDIESWWLFGTEGCHLCHQIEQELSILKKSYLIANIQMVDIIELNEQLLTKTAHHIPILITDKAIFNYPFGVMDIINSLS